MKLVALDVAILPPPALSDLAIELSAGLPAAERQGLRLGPGYLPHVTLSQQFISESDLDAVLESVGRVIAATSPLELRVSGGGRGSSSVWLEIEITPALRTLHERLMHALKPFERNGGTAAAFVDGAARPGDVRWVSDYRRKAAFAAFSPHITLGHARKPPEIAPFTFVADRVAVCHLGRFCSCRRVLKEWTLA